MAKELKLRQVTSVMSDETSGYVGEFTGTLSELVERILAYGQWGKINVAGLRVDYKKEKLSEEFPDQLLEMNVASVIASGGWGRMDYEVTLTEGTYDGGGCGSEVVIHDQGDLASAVGHSQVGAMEAAMSLEQVGKRLDRLELIVKLKGENDLLRGYIERLKRDLATCREQVRRLGGRDSGQ